MELLGAASRFFGNGELQRRPADVARVRRELHATRGTRASGPYWEVSLNPNYAL